MNAPSQCRSTAGDIAIIGIAARYPGGNSLAAFWENLMAGRETITTFSREDLMQSGIPEAVLDNPAFIPKRGILEAVDCFDAGFFGYSPREAELLDPQQRVFLESAWTALEDAGYAARSELKVGVYAGANQNTYLLFHLLRSEEALANAHALVIYSDKDFLATRVSHKLDLRGPSVTAQTACSTSLVCVHLACQSLLAYECDMALAGGVSVVFPQAGYIYTPDGVFAPDGHCRSFDKKAAGTLGSDGVGVVLLKRFDDAVRDGDHLYAAILGSAINNDGAKKASFAAPSVDGQLRVINDAHAIAAVDPKSIRYVEAHGTGTPLGDPIEMTALSRALQARGVSPGSCVVGSIKPNIGHTDQAAGVANLIKATMVVRTGKIPPLVHFQEANPQIDFQHSPLRVTTTLEDWPEEKGPRRAAVSSFGFGGTNAHVIIEEPPSSEAGPSPRHLHLLPLSARTPDAFAAYARRHGEHLRDHPSRALADAAYVMQTGRNAFPLRGFVVAGSAEEAAQQFLQPDFNVTAAAPEEPPVYFLFPGQGTQYCGMAAELYAAHAVFRREVDESCAILQPVLGLDLRSMLFPAPAEFDRATEQLRETRWTQPALFVIEHALARLCLGLGIKPAGMIGHSLGEWVAACIAGVFSKNDALRLVARRAALMNNLPPGEMIAVAAAATAIADVVGEEVAVAAINAPGLCVLSGRGEPINQARSALEARGISCTRLRTSHAFHSPMTEPILAAFEDEVAQTTRSAPTLPFISGVSGKWITASEATDPHYWSKQLRQPVRYADGIGELLHAPHAALLELGPGTALCTLTRLSGRIGSEHLIVPTLRKANDRESSERTFLTALGKLWSKGKAVEWKQYWAGEKRRRVSVPTYPFERTRYLVPAPKFGATAPAVQAKLVRLKPEAWVYQPTWSSTPRVHATAPSGQKWLILAPDPAFADVLLAQGRAQGASACVVHPGAAYEERGESAYLVRPGDAHDLERLWKRLEAADGLPDVIIAAWLVGPDAEIPDSFSRAQQRGLETVLALARVLAARKHKETELLIAGTGLHDVTGCDRVHLARTTVLGMHRGFAHELQHVKARVVDVGLDPDKARVAAAIGSEVGQPGVAFTAYRGSRRWELGYQRIKGGGKLPLVRSGEVVLITGGLGEVGLTLATHLTKVQRCKLVLVARTEIPDQATWHTHQAATGRPALVRILSRLQQLSDAGAEFLVVRADVADEQALRAAFAAGRDRFGRIDVVVHAAGVSGPGVFQEAARTTRDDLERHYRAKIHGVEVLHDIVAERTDIRVCLLQSSIFSVSGGPGCAALCAGSIYLDRAAEQWNKEEGPTRWLSVSWDAWLPDGMKISALTDSAVTAADLPELFDRLGAALDCGHVVVSTSDLPARIARWTDAEGTKETKVEVQYDRPALRSTFVAPSSNLESALAQIWQKMLGIRELGVNDDFFELGGHSLLATHLVGELKTTYPINFDLGDLVEHATIARLAALIEQRLIEKVAAMTDAEAEQMATLSS